MASTGKDSHRDILNSAVQSFLCQIEKGDQSPDDLPQFVNATLKSLGYDTDVPLPEDIQEFVKEICRSLEYEFGTHVTDALNFVLESCKSEMETGSLSPEDLPQFVNAILLSLGYVTEIPVSEEDPQQLVKATPRRQEYKLDIRTKKVRMKSTEKDKDSARRIKFFQFVTRVLDKNVSKRNNDMKLLESSEGRHKKPGGGFIIEACFTAATGALLLVPFDPSGSMLIVAIVVIAGGLLGLAYECSKRSPIRVYFKRVFEGLKEITRKNKNKNKIAH